MSKILVLDCTLRDGGYVNNWDFGRENILSIIDKLSQSNIDMIECGFISQTKKLDEDKSIFDSVEDMEKCLPKDKSCVYAAMINYGEYNIDDLPDYAGGLLKTLRIAFHQEEMKDAVEYCKKIKQKGYNVFVQPMVTLNYSKEEILWLVNETNSFMPHAVYIVDSFGTMNKTQLLGIYSLFEENLDKNIAIGFHSHNNMQLSFSNAQELMDIQSSHDIIIDSSVYGMGRGAGNLCTELITKYVNDNYGGNYDLIPILEIIDEQLMPVFLKTPWGYSVPFYVASINNCHPNYASFLLERQTLSVKDIHKILRQIADDKRVNYDKNYIRKLYESYQSKHIDDADTVAELKKGFAGKKVVVIAPGRSIIEEKKKLIDFCSQNSPVIISVNFECEFVKPDYVFVGNQKRFRQIKKTDNNIILTSNIESDLSNKIVVDYTDLLNENEYISDNSGMMILNLIKKCDVKDVYLAGFDGFSENVSDNYYREKLISGSTKSDLINISNAIQEKIRSLKDCMNIEFLTSSIYD